VSLTALKQHVHSDGAIPAGQKYFLLMMLAMLITLTSGRRNEFIDCQNARVRITVVLIMAVKTRWNSTLELVERAY